tara:strand:- start:10682 stop:11050 length:369 start_codon:yes stop_codon:yes gene_type:complete
MKDPAYVWKLTGQRLSSDRKRYVSATVYSDDKVTEINLKNIDPGLVDLFTQALNDAYQRGWKECRPATEATVRAEAQEACDAGVAQNKADFDAQVAAIQANLQQPNVEVPKQVKLETAVATG